MSEKIATFKDLDTIASLVEGTTSGYISGAISNMCVSKRNFDIVSSKTIAAVGNGLILKDNSDSSEYDPDRLILKDDVEITKTKCTIILSGESKQYHNTAFVRCTASVDGKLYWGESENAMTNQIEITAEVEANVISRTSVGTTAIYAYFVPTNPIYPTLGDQGDSYVSASAEITKAEDAGISVTTYSRTYNGSAQEVATCTSSHGTSEWYIGYTTTSSSTNVTWGEKNTNLSLTNAGTYYIWKKWKGDSNHNSHDGVKIDATVIISNATFTVTAPNQSYIYNGSAQGAAITVSDLKGNQTATIMYGTTNGSYNTTTVPKITNANEDKTIYWQVTVPNHATQTGRYTLTINKATPTLTLTGVTKTYDGNTYCVSANASVAGTVYYGTTSGSMQYKINATANRTVNLASISRTTVGTTTVYAYLVPTDSTNYNNSTNVGARISIGQVSSTLSYTPEDVQTYCLNSNIALVKSQIVECMGAQGGGKFNYEVVAYDQEGSTISGFDISKYYLWTIEEGGGVVKGIVTYKRNPMEMALSDIVCIYLVDGQGMEAYVGLDNHRDVDEPWTHVANTSTDGENILKLAWSADGGEGIDEYTFDSELSDVPFDTFAISIPEGLSVGDYNIAITVKQADSNYEYDELTRIFVLSVLPDEHTGVYDGTLSINTTPLIAGDDSRVITWGAVYTNWKYGGDKVYYPYPSNLSIECNVSAASEFVSIDKISYSNSEQVTTSVLTKQSFRDTRLDYTITYKISLLTYNGSLVKSINVNASSNTSTLKSTRIEYGTPTILVADTLTPGASRATVTCEVWNKDINTYTWTSGYESESEGAPTAGGATWTINSQTFTSKGGSTSGSTVIYRFSQNNNTLSHSSMGTNVGTDKVTLTAVNADAFLAGVTTTGVNKTISVYNDKQHTITSLTVSYVAINAGNTTSTPTVRYNTSYKYLSGSAGGTTTGNTWTYSSLPLLNAEKTLTPTFSFSGSTTYATIDRKSGVVTWKTVNGSTSVRTCYVNCSASLTSQGLTTTASTASSVAVKQNGLSGGGTGGDTVTGNTEITFYGSVGTTVPYTVTLDNQTVSIPGTYNVSTSSPFIVVTARNNTTVQKHVSVTCSNASGVTASMQPTSGQITLNKKGQSGETNLITVFLTRSSTVASASVDIYISTD